MIPQLLKAFDYETKPKAAIIRAKREETKVRDFVNSTYFFFTGKDIDFYSAVVNQQTVSFSGGAHALTGVLKARRVKQALEFSEWRKENKAAVKKAHLS